MASFGAQQKQINVVVINRVVDIGAIVIMDVTRNLRLVLKRLDLLDQSNKLPIAYKISYYLYNNKINF